MMNSQFKPLFHEKTLARAVRNPVIKNFACEPRKRQPKAQGLTPRQVKLLHEAHRDYALPIQARTAESVRLESRLSDLINEAYSLTPAETALLWRTAPPRMPIRTTAIIDSSSNQIESE